MVRVFLGSTAPLLLLAVAVVFALRGSLAQLSLDRRMRFHRLRAVARQVVEQLLTEHRQVLRAYTEGVNAGLAALWVRPPEYLALRAAPQPWREEAGVFHMPGGQSGHFWSPHCRAGHEAWAEGKPTPLLPGATEHRLVLKPARVRG